MMRLSEAIFAAGCFWGVQAQFDQVDGVVQTEVGYIGGEIQNPTYERVCRGDTNYAEVVKVIFDESVVSYSDLLDVFFDIHDPTTLNRQGVDIGTQYRSAIFYVTDEQKNIALERIKKINDLHLFKLPIVTKVEPVTTFYKAEEYHQKYLAKKGKSSCGFSSNNDDYWQEKLDPKAYAILRQKATEAPFTGDLLYEKGEGIYVCGACANPIFHSENKFDSGSGWPSFDQAIDGSVKFAPDFSHGMNRLEVVCARCGSHLGHVFDDGPKTTGKRFCINSGAMNFEAKGNKNSPD